MKISINYKLLQYGYVLDLGNVVIDYVNDFSFKQIIWEKDGKKLLQPSEDFSLSYDGERCVLTIKRVYPEDEGEYHCIASNNIGKTVSSACIIVDGMLNTVFLFTFIQLFCISVGWPFG